MHKNTTGDRILLRKLIYTSWGFIMRRGITTILCFTLILGLWSCGGLEQSDSQLQRARQTGPGVGDSKEGQKCEVVSGPNKGERPLVKPCLDNS